MRNCNKCKKTYPDSEFFIDKRDGSLRSYCKQCSYQINKKYRQTERGKEVKEKARLHYRKKQLKFINELKQRLKCQYCQEDCPECLDFHHLHSKDNQVTAFKTWTKIINELQKCTVLCCNCHRKEHNGVITIKKSSLDIPKDLIDKYIQRKYRVKF